MSQPWQLGITAARDCVRSGALSAAELAASVLDRLAATEPDVHAWAAVADDVMAQADRIDRLPPSGRARLPLAGIPVGIKDVIDVEGVAGEAGSSVLAGRRPTEDAAVVTALRNAGAIILGKTVTHEFALGQGHPATLNPWGAERYAGGSSVGSGAAVAVGSALGCLGTDTGGSVRNPAAVNGLTGMRPSAGTVDLTGVVRASWSFDQIGPIARSVRDLGVLLGAMGVAGVGEVTEPVLPPRIGVDPAMWQDAGVDPEVRTCVEDALGRLESAGAQVVEVRLPGAEVITAATITVALAEAASVHRAWLTERAADYLPATRVMLEVGLLARDDELDLARQVGGLVRQQVRETFDRHELAAIASPTLPVIAPLLSRYHSGLTDAETGDGLSGALRLLTPASLCGLPAVSLPGGLVADQPVGLHLCGRHGADAELLGLAALAERLLGLELRPPAWH
ncbi:amidase [Amycolatopsis jejuensis]|uniref:amidase n=1 Tax=Amycolatopsis jejuensis TaxID=330084 RepID=UPI000690EFDE|nr:amidase [Amycolatopsis jejuensis]